MDLNSEIVLTEQSDWWRVFHILGATTTLNGMHWMALKQGDAEGRWEG